MSREKIAMPILTRQYFATSGQFSDAVIRQITLTLADNQVVNAAVQAATAAVQAASPDAQIVYGTFSYQTVAGRWVRQIDLLVGLASPLTHFRYALLFNMKNNLGDYYVDVSTMQTFDLTDAVVAVPFTGPLDTLQISPIAAWSLRRLTGQWPGAAIRVTRASDGAQQDIGFTVTGDLDLDALAAFAGSGDVTVNTWYDQSGNGHHASAPSAAQPFIVQAGALVTVAGQPAIQSYSFDPSGNSRTLAASLPSIVTNTSPLSMSVVFNCSVQRAMGVAYDFIRAMSTGTTTGQWMSFLTSSAIAQQRIMAASVSSYTVSSSNNPSTTSFNSASFNIRGTLLSLWLNGVLSTSTSGISGAGILTSITLGVPWMTGTGVIGSIMTSYLAEAILLPPGYEDALYVDQQAYWNCP
jgi:Alpha-L-arabinofuranosidase B, catalytic